MKMYTQEEVEKMIDAATTEHPSTAEGWLKHFKGNITKCAEALGVSMVTLRKHRDNGSCGPGVLKKYSIDRTKSHTLKFRMYIR